MAPPRSALCGRFPGRARARIGFAATSSLSRCICFAKPSSVALCRVSPASSGRPAMAPAASFLPSGRRAASSLSLSSLPMNLGHRFLIQWPRMLHTPSGANFAKESLKNHDFVPAVLGRENSRNFCTYLNSFKHALFTKLPLSLFRP